MAYQANTRDTAKSRISTDGVQLYGDESTIRLDFWNQSVSVKISPLKGPEDEGNGVYAYKKTISTAMSPDTAVVFGHLIEKDIIPALIAGEAKQIGIQSSKLNMVYISTGVEETGKVEPYIALFIGIDETRKPSKTAVFKFRKRNAFSKFDPNTGEFEPKDVIVEEMRFLADFFKSAINITGAIAHGYDCGHADEIEAEYQFKNGIGNKLGVAYNVGNNYNYASRAAQKDPWGSNDSSPAVEQAPTTTVGSMDDIAGLLATTLVPKGLKKHLLFGDPIKKKKVRLVDISDM